MVTDAKATELKLKELEKRCAENVAELSAKSANLATAQNALEAERNASSNLTTELNAIRAKTAQNIENAKRTATTAQQKVIQEAQAQLQAAEAATTEARRQCDQTTIQHMSQISNLTGQISSLKANTLAQVQEIQALLTKVNSEKQAEITRLQQQIKECNDKLSAHSVRTYANVVSGRTDSGGGGSSSSSASSVTPASGTVWRVHPHQGRVSFGSGTSSPPSSPSSGNEIFAFTRPAETATTAAAATTATTATAATDSQIVPHVVRIDNRTTVLIPLIYHRIGNYGALEYFEFTKDEGLVGRSPAQATVIINKYLKEKGYGPSNRYSYMGAVPNRGKKHFRTERNKRKNNPLRKTRKNRK
jgi:predicted  nucleic acid-binding Zn-ribbon protein